MELLLFVLFMLFSMFSALMERRKRRKQVEEAQKQQEAREQRQTEQKVDEAEIPASRPAAPVVVVGEEKEHDKEEDPSFGWPFEGDPFEDFRPTAVDPASPTEQTLAAEREALAAERRAVAVEKQALALERMSLATGPGSALESLNQDAGKSQRRNLGKIGRWRFDSQKTRDAIIYAEIIGKPVGERED